MKSHKAKTATGEHSILRMANAIKRARYKAGARKGEFKKHPVHKTTPHKTESHKTTPHKTTPHKTASHKTASHKVVQHKAASHKSGTHKMKHEKSATHKHKTATHVSRKSLSRKSKKTKKTKTKTRRSRKTPAEAPSITIQAPAQLLTRTGLSKPTLAIAVVMFAVLVYFVLQAVSPSGSKYPIGAAIGAGMGGIFGIVASTRTGREKLMIAAGIVIGWLIGALVAKAFPSGTQAGTTAGTEAGTQAPTGILGNLSALSPVAIAGIIAAATLVVFIVVYFGRRLVGGQDDEISSSEQELRAELKFKGAAKDAPKFYGLALEILNATSVDKTLSRDQKNEIYAELLRVSKSGNVSKYTEISAFKGLKVPDIVIQEAEASVKADEILAKVSSGEKELDADALQKELETELKDVKPEYAASVKRKFDSFVNGLREAEARKNEPLSEEEEVLLKKNRGDDSNARRSGISWGTLFGLPDTMTRYVNASKSGDLFKRPVRLVFEGPPGVGKSAAISAMLAADPDLTVIRLTPSDLGALRGQGAQKLDDVYRLMKKLKYQGKKCVLFLDEVDSMVSDPEFRNKLQIMTNDKDISLVMATNYYDRLPAPIQSRAKKITFRLPTKTERAQILKSKIADELKKGNGVLSEDLIKNIDILATYKQESRKLDAAVEEAFKAATERAEDAAKESGKEMGQVVLTFEDVKEQLDANEGKKSRVQRGIDYFRR